MKRDGEGKDKSLAGSTGQADTSRSCATLGWVLAKEGGLVAGRERLAGLKTKKVRAALEGDEWWWRLTQGDLGRSQGTSKVAGHLFGQGLEARLTPLACEGGWQEKTRKENLAAGGTIITASRQNIADDSKTTVSVLLKAAKGSH